MFNKFFEVGFIHEGTHRSAIKQALCLLTFDGHGNFWTWNNCLMHYFEFAIIAYSFTGKFLK